MAITASGEITLADLQTEFGTASPVSLSDFYLDGSIVTSNNTGVPNSGNPISLSQFYSVANATNVIYEIIGGGGGGGYGVDNNTGSGRGGTGGNSTLAASAFTTLTSTGALGGLNAETLAQQGGRAGSASHYGSGGASVGNHVAGNAAPTTSYGAGGGGGGGDSQGPFGQDGAGGAGGSAATRLAGTLSNVPVGTVITVMIGDGGAGSSSSWAAGGQGAGGYARLQVGNTVQEFTSSGTFTVPS
jgi:hypothetical protein